MGKPKAFNVTTKPTGKAARLPARDGETRTVVRHYHLRAKSAADARKRVDAEEQRLADQEGTKPYKIDAVNAA